MSLQTFVSLGRSRAFFYFVKYFVNLQTLQCYQGVRELPEDLAKCLLRINKFVWYKLDNI